MEKNKCANNTVKMIYFHCTIDIIETLKEKLQYKNDLWMSVSKKKKIAILKMFYTTMDKSKTNTTKKKTKLHSPDFLSCSFS